MGRTWQLDDKSVAELRRMRNKLDSIAGPGVVHTRDRVYVGREPRRREPKPRRVVEDVWVRVTDPAPQDGVYYGVVLNVSATSAVDPATVTPDDIGASTGQTVVIINKGPEVGTDGHSLTESPVNARDFRGTPVGVTNETPGRLVVLINAVDMKAC